MAKRYDVVHRLKVGGEWIPAGSTGVDLGKLSKPERAGLLDRGMIREVGAPAPEEPSGPRVESAAAEGRGEEGGESDSPTGAGQSAAGESEGSSDGGDGSAEAAEEQPAKRGRKK